MAAAGYTVIAVVALAWSGVRGMKDLDGLIEAIGLALADVGVVVWVWGFVIALGLPSWYLERYGVETDAVVSAEHCDGDRGPACEQDLRVASLAGRDLGWVGCNGTGHWKVGASVRVRADPGGWVAPQIANCGGSGFLGTMIAISLGVGVVAFAAAAAAPLFAGRGRDAEDSASPRSARAGELVEDRVAEPEDAVPSTPPRRLASPRQDD